MIGDFLYIQIMDDHYDHGYDGNQLLGHEKHDRNYISTRVDHPWKS